MRFETLKDMVRSLARDKAAAFAFGCIAALVLLAAVAPPIIDKDPFEIRNLDIMSSFTPPAWVSGGSAEHLLGTDDQGRDMVLAIIYGLRTSLLIGVGAVLLGMGVGVTLGLISGYFGGWIDIVLMRIADVQLAYPALLIAMVAGGIASGIAGGELTANVAVLVVVLSIGLSFWVQYARTVRSSVLVERNQEYVLAARVTGLSGVQILLLHILPNILGPVFVIATINLGIAIITEASLSFLGVGLPLSQPTLGTLIRNGNTYLNSGEWWILAWPSVVLVALVTSVNVFGDWLRDHMNPRLRRRV